MASSSSCVENHEEDLLASNDDLSEAQIQQLLHDAGQRLQSLKGPDLVASRSIEKTSEQAIQHMFTHR